MSSTTIPDPLDGFEAMAKLGDELDTTDTNEQKTAAYKAVSRLFSAVNSGKLELDVLTQLVAWTENPGSPSQVQQQPMALGAGSTPAPDAPAPAPEIDDMSALTFLWNSTTLDEGVQNALKRLFAPNGDPTRIEVQEDGTPSMIPTLQAEVAAKSADVRRIQQDLTTAENKLTQAQDTTASGSLAQQLQAAQAELTDERDPRKVGSLRHKLDTANTEKQAAEQNLANERDASVSGSLQQRLEAALATPVNTVAVADVKAELDNLEQAWATKKKARTSDSMVLGVNATQKIDDSIHGLFQLIMVPAPTS